MSPDPGIKSKVGGKLSGLAKKADMLGAIVGYLGTFAAVHAEEGVPFFQGIIARHVNAVKIHNIQALSDIPLRVTTNPKWNGMIIGGLGVGVAGWLASYLPSVVPWQGTLTSFAKKAGFGAALGGLLAVAVGEVSEGSGGSTLDGSPTSNSNAKSVSFTGRYSKPGGEFAVQTPYVGTWVRPR